MIHLIILKNVKKKMLKFRRTVKPKKKNKRYYNRIYFNLLKNYFLI